MIKRLKIELFQPTKSKVVLNRPKLALMGKIFLLEQIPMALIMITGVESEEVEGINEAYIDFLEELGIYILSNETIFKMGCLQAML